MERTITSSHADSNVRPMQLGEILDGSFSIYRRHFGLFMRLSLVLICTPAVVGVYFATRAISNPVGTANWVQDHVAAAIGFGLLVLFVWIMISLLLKAGTIRIISDSYLGNEPSLGAALQFGTARIMPLLFVAICKTLLIFVLYIAMAIAVVVMGVIGRMLGMGGLFLFLGGIAALWLFGYVLCGYGLTSMVVVLEDLASAFDAFGRSAELTRDSRLKVFFTWLVIVIFTNILPSIVVFGISALIGPESPIQPFLSLGTIVLGVVLAPILPCALTLLYYDLRVRREAFDLEILSERLGTR
jgi:hypothetical protein